MTLFCPHHPGRTGNELPECRWCIQEAVLTDPAQGAAQVRAALAAAPRPPAATEPRPATNHAHEIAKARAKADRALRDQLDHQEEP